MKTTTLFLLFALLGNLVALPTLAQTIRRVNNTPGLNDPAVYATAQAAHNAAATGDIISLEPSDNANYGSLMVTKRVTIVGPGYFLDKNPNTSFDKRGAGLNSITFENGSANSSVMGVYFFGNGTISIKDVNIKVARCSCSGASNVGIAMNKSNTLLAGVYSSGNNAEISNNLLSNVQGELDGNNNIVAGLNCTITNNIFLSGLVNMGGCVINYNTFPATSLQNVRSSTFTNNIIDARLATNTSTAQTSPFGNGDCA